MRATNMHGKQTTQSAKVAHDRWWWWRRWCWWLVLANERALAFCVQWIWYLWSIAIWYNAEHSTGMLYAFDGICMQNVCVRRLWARVNRFRYGEVVNEVAAVGWRDWNFVYFYDEEIAEYVEWWCTLTTITTSTIPVGGWFGACGQLQRHKIPFGNLRCVCASVAIEFYARRAAEDLLICLRCPMSMQNMKTYVFTPNALEQHVQWAMQSMADDSQTINWTPSLLQRIRFVPCQSQDKYFLMLLLPSSSSSLKRSLQNHCACAALKPIVTYSDIMKCNILLHLSISQPTIHFHPVNLTDAHHTSTHTRCTGKQKLSCFFIPPLLRVVSCAAKRKWFQFDLWTYIEILDWFKSLKHCFHYLLAAIIHFGHLQFSYMQKRLATMEWMNERERNRDREREFQIKM